jgi:hypothetical protein
VSLLQFALKNREDFLSAKHCGVFETYDEENLQSAARGVVDGRIAPRLVPFCWRA